MAEFTAASTADPAAYPAADPAVADLLAAAREHIASSDGTLAEEGLQAPPAPAAPACPFLTAACASRYLAGNDGDSDAALKQLVATLEWRTRARPWERCMLCAEDGMSHNLRCVGYDAEGNAVIFTSFGQAHDRKDKDMAMTHMTWVLESTALCMDRRAARMVRQVARQVVEQRA